MAQKINGKLHIHVQHQNQRIEFLCGYMGCIAMTQASYQFARQKLQHAANCLHEARTVYEGLATAYLQALKWIDPRDVPPNLRYLMLALVECFPFRQNPGTPTHRRQVNDARAALRTLDHDYANALARRLLTLSDLVTSCSDGGNLIGPDTPSLDINNTALTTEMRNT